MNAGTVFGALWTLFASSSGFLLLGLFAAGLVHVLSHRFGSFRRAVPRGWKAIGLGIVAGLPMPVCSCGIAPVALALKRRNAHPETVAAFAVSTPETSLDAVGLTAALFGLPFALFRILAGLVAAVLAGFFVIAFEAWPGEKPDEAADEDLTGHLSPGHAPPEWWHHLIAWVKTTWIAWFGEPPKPAEEALETAPAVETIPLRTRVRRTFADALRVGFVETLDEIAWMLLIGFVISALVLVILPNDFATRIPGGVAGQTLFGLLISLPLYVCASGSIPLAAALMAKGLSPVAVLAIFLVGPVTNPASLLVFGRSFGRRFVVALIVAGLIAAVLFGAMITSTPKVPPPSDEEQASAPLAQAGGWDVLFTIVFLPLFLLSLARTGLRRGADDLRLAFASVVPADARRALRGGSHWVGKRRRQLAWSALSIVIGAWILSGFVVISEGSAGFAEVFGRASRLPLLAGLHWIPPRPIGRLRRIDAGSVVNVSVGFRPGPEERSQNDLVIFTPAADSGWHSIYTSSGPRPEESNYVTGDLNLVESKANIHLRISDPRLFAYQGGDAVETVRRRRDCRACPWSSGSHHPSSVHQLSQSGRRTTGDASRAPRIALDR